MAGSLPALAMERAEQLYRMVCAGIDKKNGVVSGGGGGSSGSGGGSNNGVSGVPTPAIYQNNTTEDADVIASVATDAIPITSTTTTNKVPLSPPFQPKKATPLAGTCILKDFGRTAKNPTLKNLAINSTNVEGGADVGSGGSRAAGDVAIVAVPRHSAGTVLCTYDITDSGPLRVFPNSHNLNGLCSVSGAFLYCTKIYTATYCYSLAI